MMPRDNERTGEGGRKGNLRRPRLAESPGSWSLDAPFSSYSRTSGKACNCSKASRKGVGLSVLENEDAVAGELKNDCWVACPGGGGVVVLIMR